MDRDNTKSKALAIGHCLADLYPTSSFTDTKAILRDRGGDADWCVFFSIGFMPCLDWSGTCWIAREYLYLRRG